MFTHERLKYNTLKSVTKQAYHRQAQSLGLVRMIIFYQNINDTVFNLSRSYEQVVLYVVICMLLEIVVERLYQIIIIDLVSI